MEPTSQSVSQSSKQICEACSQPILSLRGSLDETQVQRICDICARTLAPNEPSPAFIADRVIVANRVIVSDPALDDDSVFGNDYDANCDRMLSFMKYAIAAAISGIGLLLLIVSGDSGDSN